MNAIHINTLLHRGARMPLTCLALVSSLCFAFAAPAAAQPPAEVGMWYDDTGRGAVEISECGKGLCGHIVWLKEPNNEQGQPLRDVYNPEPGLNGRPICGIQVLGDLQPLDDGAWGNGWVYDPKVGKSYNVEIRMLSRTKLEVYGYAGVKLFGRSLNWTRAPEDLPRCDRDAAGRAGLRAKG